MSSSRQQPTHLSPGGYASFGTALDGRRVSCGASEVSGGMSSISKEGLARRRSVQRQPRQSAQSVLSNSVTGFSVTYSRLYSSQRGPTPHSAVSKMAKWFLKTGQTKTQIITLIVVFSVLVRLCVGLGGYSGYLSPPMRGDFEAQRHWTAITSSKSISEWYFYDLQYWGLDYPPLTAYHSWLIGTIARLHPQWKTFMTIRPPLATPADGAKALLDNTRNISEWSSLTMTPLEQAGDLKTFMRLTSLVSDVAVYVSAVVYYCYLMGIKNGHGSSRRTSYFTPAQIATVLLQPALILVDHGHFQYNCVMLGFTIWAVNMFYTGRDLLGAFFFVCSLCFKQMALYYSPAVFGYLLGKCVWMGLFDMQTATPGPGFYHLARIGAVTLGSFVLLFLPFLTSLDQIGQVIFRIFPLQRGLFEDKVANFWCTLNVVVKLQKIASIPFLARASLTLTLISILPCIGIFLYASYKKQQTTNNTDEEAAVYPLDNLLPYALLASSMAFYLFSFQVHEKSILLPLMPLTLLINSNTNNENGDVLGFFVNNIAVFSMWPLLSRDGQGIAYIVLPLLWNLTCRRTVGFKPVEEEENVELKSSLIDQLSLQWLVGPIYFIAGVIHVLWAITSPPAHLPDLFVVFIVGLSAPVFGFTLVWAYVRLFLEGRARRPLKRLTQEPARVSKPFPLQLLSCIFLPRIGLSASLLEYTLGSSNVDPSKILRSRRISRST